MQTPRFQTIATKKQAEPRIFHDFPVAETANEARAEYAKAHPLPSRLLHAAYGAEFSENGYLRNPLKVRQSILFHIGRPSHRSPDYRRFQTEFTHVRITLEPGETRELPFPFVLAAHFVVKGEVLAGEAPLLRRLEKDPATGHLEDVTPPLSRALQEALPDHSPTRARVR